MNKNILNKYTNLNEKLLMATLATIVAFSGDNICTAKNQNIDSNVANTSVISISNPADSYIVPMFDIVYCQPTSEDLKKRNVYFKRSHQNSLALGPYDPVTTSERPVLESGRNYDAERNASRNYERLQRTALKHNSC